MPGFWRPVKEVDAETGEFFKHMKSTPKNFPEYENLPEKGLSFVIAHEIGHSLGFPHSSDPKSIMYNKKTDDQAWRDRKPKLNSFSDKALVRSKYGKRNIEMDPVCKYVWDEGKDYVCLHFQEKTTLECKKVGKGYNCWCEKHSCGGIKKSKIINAFTSVFLNFRNIDCERMFSK